MLALLLTRARRLSGLTMSSRSLLQRSIDRRRQDLGLGCKAKAKEEWNDREGGFLFGFLHVYQAASAAFLIPGIWVSERASIALASLFLRFLGCILGEGGRGVMSELTASSPAG